MIAFRRSQRRVAIEGLCVIKLFLGTFCDGRPRACEDIVRVFWGLMTARQSAGHKAKQKKPSAWHGGLKGRNFLNLKAFCLREGLI